MPRLSTFPKGFLDELCVSGALTLDAWLDLCDGLDIDGHEFYCGFLDLQDPDRWSEWRRKIEDKGLEFAMMCCSPDFTHPDPDFRRREIDKEKHWIDMTAALGGSFCRVLSGQRRPEVGREDGIGFAAECIAECAVHAQALDVALNIENHYKDSFWRFPEFAQHMDVFCDLLGRLTPEQCGVNYDPSNTILAGEDPLELLRRVKHRVVTLHASDRYLKEGTIEDLRREEAGSVGYAERLHHGVIGQGLNDYDAIFSTLADVGFDGWISVEDGVDGFEGMAESVQFLRAKMREHFPASQ